MKLPSLKKPVAKAAQAKISAPAVAAKRPARASEPAHEHVVLTGAFETWQGGNRTFKAGPRSLPKALADEARARGLVADPGK